MKRGTARVYIFFIWFIFLLTYAGTFVFIFRGRNGIDRAEVHDAAWHVIGTILPVCSAFYGFWFTPNDQRRDDSKLKVDLQKFYIVLITTIAIHGFLLAYILISILSEDFSPSIDPTIERHPQDSFKTIANQWLQMLWILTSFAVIPVGWLLKGTPPVIPRPGPVVPVSPPGGIIAVEDKEGG